MTTNLLRAALVIGGCAGLMGWSQPGQAQDRPPPKAPVARVCKVKIGVIEAGVVPPGTITVSGEGGWCTIFRGLPYIIVTPPEHGELVRADVGPWHLYSYRPTAHYTGADTFQLRTAGVSISLTINVTVVP
jgi:hypothetical protein